MGQFKRVMWMMAVASMAAAQNDPPGRVGRISFMSGTVSFQPGGVDEWVTADLSRPLTIGDHVWVDQDGRAEVSIGSAALRLSSKTAFEFLNLDDQNVQVRLAEGSLEIRLRTLDEGQAFEVDTPNLAFSLLRPGSYRIDANVDTQTTTITVRAGEGEVSGGGQAFSVKPGQQARVTGDQSVTYDLAGAPPPDWFDNWCVSRDRRDDMSPSARYVSRDMIGYADLDNAGDWRPAPEYGTVWYPRAVPAGWAPYRYGHWAWIEPWGWTWVDDAAWGFAPFHYGRWAFIGGSWGWVPGPVSVRPVYAPALVAFVGGVGGVAWFPLGPREVYVPSYRVSSGYVTRINTSNTVINNVTVMNVYNNRATNIRYMNQAAAGGVTAVSRETFVGARPVGQARVEISAQAAAGGQVVRGAAFAPSRESVVGYASRVSSARPPQAILARQVVAKSTPPPPPVAFAQRQQALQRNPGQPLEAGEMQRIRTASGAPVRPMVRQATAVPMNGAPGRRAEGALEQQQRALHAAPAQPAVAPQAAAPQVARPNSGFQRPVEPAQQAQPQRQNEANPGRRVERPVAPQAVTPPARPVEAAPQAQPQRQNEANPGRPVEEQRTVAPRPVEPTPQVQPQRQNEANPGRRAEEPRTVAPRPVEPAPQAQPQRGTLEQQQHERHAAPAQPPVAQPKPEAVRREPAHEAPPPRPTKKEDKKEEKK